MCSCMVSIDLRLQGYVRVYPLRLSGEVERREEFFLLSLSLAFRIPSCNTVKKQSFYEKLFFFVFSFECHAAVQVFRVSLGFKTRSLGNKNNKETSFSRRDRRKPLKKTRQKGQTHG